jgi:hypothetical protein
MVFFDQQLKAIGSAIRQGTYEVSDRKSPSWAEAAKWPRWAILGQYFKRGAASDRQTL